MKVTDILVEKVSDVVYHFTSYGNAIKILKHNTIGLSPFLAKDVESKVINTKKLFYLSTARSKLGNYGQNNYSMIAFVLDGRKLSQRYSAKAIDYWGVPKSSEMEDRILSDRPYIKDASQYIKSVDVFFNADDFDDKIGVIKALKLAADAINVEVRVFDTIARFNAGKNPIDLTNKLKDVEAWQSSTYRDRSGDFIEPYLNAIKGINLDDEATQKLIYKIRNYPQDVERMLKADAHNANTSEEMKELATLSKRLKLRNIKEISEYLIKKYKTA